jgi:hypothetical protein
LPSLRSAENKCKDYYKIEQDNSRGVWQDLSCGAPPEEPEPFLEDVAPPKTGPAPLFLFKTRYMPVHCDKKKKNNACVMTGKTYTRRRPISG